MPVAVHGIPLVPRDQSNDVTQKPATLFRAMLATLLCLSDSAGALPVNPLSIEDTFRRIERGLAPVLEAGARTLCVGGDHSISLPLLRAICKHHGAPVQLIQFDAHNDLWDEYFGSKYSHGTPFRRAFEEGILVDGRVLQVGLRGQVYGEEDFDFARAHKVRMVTAEEFHEKGLAAVQPHLRAFLD